MVHFNQQNGSAFVGQEKPRLYSCNANRSACIEAYDEDFDHFADMNGSSDQVPNFDVYPQY